MKITFLEPLGIPMDALRALAEEKFPGTELKFYDTRVEDAPTLIERSRDANIVVLSNFKYGREVMENCPELKMVCVAFTGYDHVDMDYCRERGITVCNCAGYSTVAVADLVFGFAVALCRNMPACDAAARAGGTKDGLVGFELEGKTFGIVGLGAIGQRVARIANAFGCRVLAYNRSKKDIPGVEQVALDEVLSRSDFVSLHVPQNASTIGLIGARELGLMKPSAYLINTARGKVVDSAALAEALKAGKIAGAAADVFEMEPPIPADHPLLSAPHILLTPHVAFASRQAFEKRAVIVMDNISGFISGNKINVVG